MIKKEKWEEKIIKGIEIPPSKDVEIVKPQPRYLWTLSADPNWTSNLWDYYYNGTNMRLRTESGWKTV